LRAHPWFKVFRARLFVPVILSTVTCTAESPPSTGTAGQAVVNPPLPSDLNPTLNARTSVTIGPATSVAGDIASVGLNGSVLLDVGAFQGCCSSRNVLANTVTVRVNASAGRIFGNDITVDGFADQRNLGLDPAQLPQIPAVTAGTPGTTNVSTNQNQAKQLCAGQYGAISLGINSTLNLNGGVYHVTRLTLADGARLEPSEPVVILVTGAVTTGIGAVIRPSGQALNQMTAADVRIEVGGNVNIGDSTQVQAHVLATGRFTTGRSVSLSGAAWARTITIGAQNSVAAQGRLNAQTPSVPPPCNDNNACTADACVGGGTTVAVCRNTPTPTGSSCEDGNVCNGAEQCNGAGTCLAGTALERGTSCADGDLCNGDEVCNGTGTCLDGTPPVVNDRNGCTTDACDPIGGVSNDPVPDGTTCSGTGVCEAGVCSVTGAVFSEDFIQFSSAPAQCNRWNDFLANDLSNGDYNSVTMSGTFDPTGVTCADPTAATQICRALHNGTFTSLFCNGRTWTVGSCGGMELSVDSSFCNCVSSGHTVRPCTGSSWGGVATDTCGGPNQNLTVICE
jgi:hypothetical protein